MDSADFSLDSFLLEEEELLHPKLALTNVVYEVVLWKLIGD